MYDEREVIKGCRKNSRLHQQMLYEHYAPKMFALCLRYSADHMQAEDFLQEGFVKVLTRIEQYTGPGSFEGWIRRIMINTALQHLRKQKNTPAEVDIENSPDIAATDDVLSDMAVEDLTKLIQTLPAGYRLVFNMFVVEEYTHKEIAAELGITEGTSKSQLARARQLLQKMIKKNENFQNKRPVASARLR
jgi:RNA polymerase sigma-70 factor (ECF subfamily)